MSAQAKHERRKHEKDIYCPRATPVLINVPESQFIRIRGAGNPNGVDFRKRIEALYPIAYGIKMTAKQPDVELQGVWSLSEQGRVSYQGVVNKDELVYELMLRQPDFVTEAFFRKIVEACRRKNDNPFFDQVEWVTQHEGPCLQMLHLGPFESEPASFAVMEQVAAEHGHVRLSRNHREIYLSDFRRTEPDRLKTVLRFKVEDAQRA